MLIILFKQSNFLCIQNKFLNNDESILSLAHYKQHEGNHHSKMKKETLCLLDSLVSLYLYHTVEMDLCRRFFL